MGITQQKKGVATIKEIINLLLLRGNIGKPGAGASPIRGHSNVQGDRTMGIWEQMPPAFLDALGKEFSFEPPREHGLDAVETVRGMRDGGIKVFVGLGGNFVGAISDTAVAEAAMENTELSVQISTKLNRSHTVTGAEALILPTMGRTEIDRQETGPQFVSVEDTVCAVHASHGTVEPVAPGLLSEVAIICRLAAAVVQDRSSADWAGFEKNYDLIRDHISHVVDGCEDYNRKIRQDGGFVLPNGPRDSRTFNTPTGKAMLTVNELEHVDRPEGTLILQSMRSHDQFNTTIYGNNDRYRGIKKGREVVFVNPDGPCRAGLRGRPARGHPRCVHGQRGPGAPELPDCLLPVRQGLRCRLLPGGQRPGAAGQRGRGQPDAGIKGRHRAPRAGSGAGRGTHRRGLTCRPLRNWARTPALPRFQPALARTYGAGQGRLCGPARRFCGYWAVSAQPLLAGPPSCPSSHSWNATLAALSTAAAAASLLPALPVPACSPAA